MWLALTDRSQHVLVNSEQSNSANVTSGIFQGTVLASLLFFLFRMYADDVILYRSIHSVEDCCNLQQDLLILEKWAKNGTCRTTSKVFLWITNKFNPILSQYLLNNEVIQEVALTKYLGVVIDSISYHGPNILRKLQARLIKLKDSYNATSITAPYQLKPTPTIPL